MDVRDRRRLGKGLASLLGQPVRIDAPSEPESAPGDETLSDQTIQSTPTPDAAPASIASSGFRRIPIDDIVPNRFQPRRDIDQGALERLRDSIKAAGIMQPIAVRPSTPGGSGGPGAAWELIAGERRWRAARLAGLTHVPAVVTELDDKDAAEWAVVENLQREDLNPIDRAWAFRSLADRFAMPHKLIAERVGLDRSSITNLIRLTELEAEIQSLIAAGRLSTGHAKALLALPAGPDRVRVATQAAEHAWSVRRLERLSSEGAAKPGAHSKPARTLGAHADLERQLSEHLGTRVTIHTDEAGTKGRIAITFFSLDQFDEIVERFGFRYAS